MYNDRTKLLIGEEGTRRLESAKVAIFGVGGVGSFTAEALARAGVGEFILVDKDLVEETNLNRQIHATRETIGLSKVEVMAKRIRSIRPECVIKMYQTFYLPGMESSFFRDADIIVDAIDNISAKIELVIKANEYGIPIVSSMGTANKMDPFSFKVDDIYQTSICPVAKVMRKELRKKGVEALRVIYSTEMPKEMEQEEGTERRVLGTISYMPAICGLLLASEVIKKLLEGEKENG